jgi:hypothetical protein
MFAERHFFIHPSYCNEMTGPLMASPSKLHISIRDLHPLANINTKDDYKLSEVHRPQ